MNEINFITKFIRHQIRAILFEDFRYEYDNETSDYKPPMDVVGTAKRALEAANKMKISSHGGNEGSGIQKAKALSNGEPINHAQLKRMKAFFDNNAEKVQAEKIAGGTIYNSEIVQKWELWGGDPGRRWVEQEIKSTQDGNIRSKKLRPKGTKTLMDPYNTRTHDANHFFNEASIGPNGDIIDLFNPFENILHKFSMTTGSGTYMGHNTYRFDFPPQAAEELKHLGFQIELERVTNKQHPDYGKLFFSIIANPKDWD